MPLVPMLRVCVGVLFGRVFRTWIVCVVSRTLPAQSETHTFSTCSPSASPAVVISSVAESTSGRQFNMLLFACFAGLALLLAGIGLYGLVSHTVSQRRAEMGIRIALGARAWDVSRMVLWQGLRPAIAGVALGLAGAVFAVRILTSQLFGVSPADPATFTVVPVVLLAIAALACFVPAWRASRIDPMVALRQE